MLCSKRTFWSKFYRSSSLHYGTNFHQNPGSSPGTTFTFFFGGLVKSLLLFFDLNGCGVAFTFFPSFFPLSPPPFRSLFEQLRATSHTAEVPRLSPTSELSICLHLARWATIPIAGDNQQTHKSSRNLTDFAQSSLQILTTLRALQQENLWSKGCSPEPLLPANLCLSNSLLA